MTVFAPGSAKAPWIPCRDREGYLHLAIKVLALSFPCISRPGAPRSWRNSSGSKSMFTYFASSSGVSGATLSMRPSTKILPSSSTS